jgi:hypothetical protein
MSNKVCKKKIADLFRKIYSKEMDRIYYLLSQSSRLQISQSAIIIAVELDLEI